MVIMGISKAAADDGVFERLLRGPKQLERWGGVGVGGGVAELLSRGGLILHVGSETQALHLRVAYPRSLPAGCQMRSWLRSICFTTAGLRPGQNVEMIAVFSVTINKNLTSTVSSRFCGCLKIAGQAVEQPRFAI